MIIKIYQLFFILLGLGDLTVFESAFLDIILILNEIVIECLLVHKANERETISSL